MPLPEVDRADHTPASLLAALRSAAAAGDGKAAAFLPMFEPFALVDGLLRRIARPEEA